jgi:hypothetical protein
LDSMGRGFSEISRDRSSRELLGHV